MLLTTEEEKALTIWLPAMVAMVIHAPGDEMVVLQDLVAKLQARGRVREQAAAMAAGTMARGRPH